jgi:hypothetical protein
VCRTASNDDSAVTKKHRARGALFWLGFSQYEIPKIISGNNPMKKEDHTSGCLKLFPPDLSRYDLK